MTRTLALKNAALIAAYGDPSDPIAYVDYPTTDPDGTGFWDDVSKFRRDIGRQSNLGL